jgi:type VI secretion system secreted protein VgrG
MEITTPLGDALLFYRMRASEELGRLSAFQIEMLSKSPSIDPDGILGKNVTVLLRLPDDKVRHFNGYVTRFEQVGMTGRYHRYGALVQPWLWFLTRTSDCRIFQDMTVPEIVKKVFADHSMADVAPKLTSAYRKMPYCVQYRETDFNFVSRLLEHEGIYYFFKHAAGRHTMVLADASSCHEKVAGYETVACVAREKLKSHEKEHIDTWEFSRSVQSGVFVHDDYDLERPSVELRTTKSFARSYSPSNYEMYDYPGEYLVKGDGEQYAGVRIEEHAAQFERARATTTARGLATGYLFTLEGHVREDQNRDYLIVSAAHHLEYSQYEGVPDAGPAEFTATFTAIASAEQYRPQRLTPKPFVQGPQTAVVVGPGGQEIYTDKYGRVKVQFHWDRRGEKNENSSCWVRVSSPWAGKNWGGIAIPRIGQEVIVDFLEGDPDQPIITGRVYNAEQMPPYELPANMTQTGIKSRSSMEGTPDNFNEIRFEDKKGSEQLFIHAEKNQDNEVENDETTWVGHDRTETVGNDERITIEGNRTESVAKDESISITGSRSESVAKNETISITGNRTESVGGVESISVAKNQSITVQGDQSLTVAKKQTISIGDSRSLSVTNNESTSIGKNRQASISENDSIKAGKNLTLAAGDQISIQTGSASITLKKDGTINIKGKDITIDASGKVNIKAGGDVVIKGSKVSQN